MVKHGTNVLESPDYNCEMTKLEPSQRRPTFELLTILFLPFCIQSRNYTFFIVHTMFFIHLF